MKLHLIMRCKIWPITLSYGFSNSLLNVLMNGRHLIFWPNHDALMKTMLPCFQESFGKKIAVFIDCFESFLKRPFNLYDCAC